MKLTSIKICNFRSFYGKTPEILLAGGDVRNITIIHGGNGAGKTSLLNAFTWVLYERFSAAFAAVEQLVNKRAIAEADIGQAVECWVEVAWEHDGKRYRVRRSSRVYKRSGSFEAGKTKLFMQVAGDDGQWYLPPQQPEDVINQILPSSLHQYFFFDGERIEQIVRSDKKAEIAEATKMLLGVEVINRSIKHLGEAKKTLESELKAIGDSETQDLLKQQGKIQKESDRLIQRLSEIEQELECQQTLKQETSNCLRELSAAKELQERLLELENQKALNQDGLKQTKEALKKAISSKGYTLLLSEKTAEFAEFTAELKQGGKLTSGVSREFLDHLIQKGRCLCGTDLHVGSRSHKSVNLWLTKAASSAVEETAIRMGAQVDIIEQQAVAFWEDVDREQARIQQLRQTISQLENELGNIQERLRKDPSEEIRNLQKRLDEIEQKIRDLTLEQGANQQQITNFQREIESLSKQVAKQEMNEARQVLAQRRIVATQDAIERLMEVKNRQEDQFRHQLEKRVQEIFSEI
ncbi:MAG: AAA family ATPase, partial [Nostocaceae cyanobacterium]|nr:AAA family ATPase [Nostocaceae cyanobacterium]